MLTQVDDDGFKIKIIQGIINYKMDTAALSKSDSYVVTHRGLKKLKKITCGWKILVK